MIKFEIIKKEFKYPCYCCRTSIRGKTAKRKTCKACNGTGFFKDEINYIVYHKNGKQFAIDSDNIG